MEGYLAEVRMFGASWAPRGWQLCDGTLLSIASDTALFALIGTLYGGNGQTTFAVPDFRGRVPVGTGSNGPVPIDLGEMSGTPTVTLMTTQMPAHTHLAIATGSPNMMADSGNATMSAATSGASLATPGTPQGRGFGATLGYGTNAPSVPLASGGSYATMAVSNSIAGGSQPHNNMQPSLGISYIICVEGIFPSRN